MAKKLTKNTEAQFNPHPMALELLDQFTTESQVTEVRKQVTLKITEIITHALTEQQHDIITDTCQLIENKFIDLDSKKRNNKINPVRMALKRVAKKLEMPNPLGVSKESGKWCVTVLEEKQEVVDFRSALEALRNQALENNQLPQFNEAMVTFYDIYFNNSDNPNELFQTVEQKIEPQLNEEEAFCLVDPTPKTSNDRNNCAVRAITVTSGLPYPKVDKACTLAGRKFKKGMFREEIIKALDILELNSVMVTDGEKRTVGQFAKQMSKGRYVVLIANHALSVVDGIVQDSAKCVVTKKVQAYFQI